MSATSAPRLVAVVVTFNRRDQLRVTIDRLLVHPADVLAAVVVCDNASTDGTAQDLSAYSDPRVHVVTLPDNRGGAGGFDAGMRAAMANHAPDWLVLMDDDGRPIFDALSVFQSAPRDAADAWAAAVTYPGGKICDMNRPWTNPFSSAAGFLRTLAKGRDGFHLGADAYTAPAPRPIDGGSFVGLFVSARAIEKVGYPDPALFLYGDDVLYTLGLTKTGGRIMFDPALRFEHDCETLSDDGPMRPLWKVYFFHRNQIFVYREAAGPVLFWPALALRALQWRWRAAAYGPDKSAYLMVLRMALRDGVARRTGLTRSDVEAKISGQTRFKIQS